jgi:hypothetical protein
VPSLTEIDVVRGADRYQTIRLTDEAGDAVTTFTGSATLAVTVWAGDATASITAGAAPTATWVDATAGTVQLYFAAAFTTLLTPGEYPVALSVTASGKTYTRRVGTLVVTPSAGSTAAGATYCTFDDMLSYAPWLPRLVADADGMLQAGLAEQRALSRDWLNHQIIERARRDITEQYRRHAPVNAATELDITTGVDAGYDWGPSIYPEPSIRTQVESIRTLLTNTNTTFLMTGDGLPARITANYAIHLACEGQLSGGDAPDYQAFGRAALGRAVVALAGFTARIDSDSDGTADYEITP